ncbi:hypothetical protein LA080_008605 [Diaporthe eres]|nr:hypothetical protein LA080_008605 [Diaporthe eres]
MLFSLRPLRKLRCVVGLVPQQRAQARNKPCRFFSFRVQTQPAKCRFGEELDYGEGGSNSRASQKSRGLFTPDPLPGNASLKTIASTDNTMPNLPNLPNLPALDEEKPPLFRWRDPPAATTDPGFGQLWWNDATCFSFRPNPAEDPTSGNIWTLALRLKKRVLTSVSDPTAPCCRNAIA